MKIKISYLLICLCFFAATAAAQSTVKLFDAEAISTTDYNVLANQLPYGSYRSVQVYMSCPTGSTPTSFITGPGGGGLVVDNYITVNGWNACPGDNCFAGVTEDPGPFVGMPVESVYKSVQPLDVSSAITVTGLYTFNLIDYGYTGGNSAIYLSTSCSIVPVNTPAPDAKSTICHRNNGNNGGRKTITVESGAVGAHLAHGDTTGACSE